MLESGQTSHAPRQQQMVNMLLGERAEQGIAEQNQQNAESTSVSGIQ